MGNLANLQQLHMENNALVDDIPASIVNLVNLSHTRLAYNKLTASDPAVLAFLNDKDPDWAMTQTVPPANLEAAARSGTSVEVTWAPIQYTGDGGYYQVSYATTGGGPYTAHGRTSDKTAASYVADGLSPRTTYYFVVRTYTPFHGRQQNDLWSAYSQEISTATLRSVFVPAVLLTGG